ncbi:Uncharacterized protein T08_15150 [Trichinella sp. T8]|nr:Uncharacterized protein T08_15150 [Trichinella sp. T8]
MTISLNECCLDNERKNVQSSSVPSCGHALFTFKCIGKINTNDGDRPSSSAIDGQQRPRYLSASTHAHTGQGGQVLEDRDPAAFSSCPLVALEVADAHAVVTSNNDSDAGLPVFLSIIRRTSAKPVTDAVINDAAQDQSTEENATAEPDGVDSDPSNEAKVITVKIYPPDVDLNSGREASFSVDIPNPFGFADIVTHLPTTTISDKQVLQIDTHYVDYSLLCRDGAPQLSDGKPLHCFSDADCMVGYWCHIGSSRITTYCCPSALADNGCNLPRLSGHGSGRMERWYHDVKLGGCQKFFYTGYGGNQNNFLTKDQCVQKLPPPVFDAHPKIPYPASALNVVDKSLASAMGFNFNPASWTYPFATYPTLPKIIPTPEPKIPTPIVQTTPRPMPIPNHSNVQNLNGILNSHQSTVQASTVPQTPYVIQRPSSGNGGQKIPESGLQNLQTYPPATAVYTSDQQSISELQATWPLYMVQQPSKPQISSVYTLPKEPMPFPKPSVNTPAPVTMTPAIPSEEGVLSIAGQPLSVHPSKQTVEFDERCLQPKMISAVNSNINGGSSSQLQWTFDALIGQCQPVMIHHQSIEPTQTLNVFSSQFECNFYCNPAAYRPASEGKGIGELVGDPCQLPLNTGQGYNLDVRWAYDQNADQCRTFLFFGFGGNANNFETEMECMAACSSQRYQFPDVLLSNKLIAGEQQYGFLQPDIRHQPISPQSILVCNGLKKINEVELCDQHNNYQCPNGQLCNYNATISVCCPVENNLKKASESATLVCNGTVLAVEAEHCSVENNFQCSPGSRCHFSPNNTSSVCCPDSSIAGHHQLDHYPSECFLPLDLGQGSRPLVRWYFDQISGRCQEFLYRGTNGNMNNFESSDECRAFCERRTCANGTPLRQQSGRVLLCSGSSIASSCPPTHFCHVGHDRLSTVCCPREGDTCSLPVSSGVGQNRLQRYAYDSNLNGCKFFLYAGTKGNANNFLSEQECFAECGRGPQPSPCALGYPALAGDGQSWLFCSSENSNICPFNYYCHIGAKKETTVCCLRTSPTSVSGFSVCQLPLQPGNGASFLSRWYFDSQSSTCKSFTYTGTGGNENNFVQLSDCRRICPEYDNACPAGTPPIDFQTGQVAFCSATNGFCSPGYWCHVGFDERSSVCCPFASDDPCSLPKSEGTGSLHIPRFFFNQTSRQCETFAYSGRKGNQNNFVTVQDCEASCPVLENPCSEGMPLINRRSNTPVFCNSDEDGTCPENYWCHMGATAAMTLCCPGDSDPCQLPQSRGNGNSVLSRWYYNTDTKMCLSFTYTGSGGNQNNFETIEACRSRCPEFQNPCTTGPPHINLNGHITRCGATTPTICPSSYWCHIGADLESSVCCPGATNPCELPVEQGSGQASLLRYGYIRETQTCRSFLYSVFRNPCINGNPARDEQDNIVLCSVADMDDCPEGYWCHVGGDEQSTLCCPYENEITTFRKRKPVENSTKKVDSSYLKNASCLMPLQVGDGVLMLPRFYFNSQTKQCLPFTYSGLGGNQNNFLSRGDCENSCPVFQNPCRQGEPASAANGQYILCTATGVHLCPANYWCHVGDSNSNSVCCPAADNPCVLPAETGTGQSVLVRWYFDRHARRCNRFVYTGSGGNENNFLAKQDCMARCPEFRNPCPIGDPSRSEKGTIVHCGDGNTGCPIGYWCHYGADAETTVCCQGEGDRCLLPMLPGIGSEKLKRWYFNQNSRQCLEFTYTGRGGNQNNFLTESQCIQECPVFLNPCPRDAGSDVDVIYCGAQNRNTCPVGYWCHVGITVETSVCCEGVHSKA